MAVRRSGRREERAVRSGARQAMGTGLALTVLLFLLPGILVGQMHVEEEPVLPAQSAAPEAVETVGGCRDRGKVVRLARQDGTIDELTLEDYLWGVVAAEMPASFEPEALKAQAAAARTYTIRLQSAVTPKHENAQLCDDSTCCQAYVERKDAEARWGLQAGLFGDKITDAISKTDGLGVLYEGKPIQAVFFSSAAGSTVDAVEVWGSAVDYLKSVDSPEGEEVPNYRTQVTLTAQEVKERVLGAYPGADLSGEPSTWFGTPEYSAGGSVAKVMVGGMELTGAQVRALFELRSATFSIKLQNGDTFLFDVTGYGHGVGMSQYGANAMAKEGADYREILTWYYTGTEVGYLWEE